ncbi:MAG: ribose 5-phosphate isomerase A [Candidatus Bathyarchaeota archaeon]|nr:ribose 5-phosphate isomerase A [Candidatus Bathyarchaeota archaeon]MDH5494292.1 ribose 5-phosphate isomerase A [Candidatus Bathyarchaeota archaeon]
MDWRDNAKKMAAVNAVEHVKEGFIVGLGSGTTVAYAFQELGKRIRQKKLRIYGVPTSYQAFLLAVQHSIPITTLNEHPQLDVAIDGADQVDEELNMIKGMGGALTREKIVASASKMNVIIVDETKLTKKLGVNQPVPVEVLPFALSTVTAKLHMLGSKPILREAEKKLGPVVTDNGNFILDVHFGPIDSPKELNRKLKVIPGIVETGLFVDIASIVYIGGKEAVRKLEK